MTSTPLLSPCNTHSPTYSSINGQYVSPTSVPFESDTDSDSNSDDTELLSSIDDNTEDHEQTYLWLGLLGFDFPELVNHVGWRQDTNRPKIPVNLSYETFTTVEEVRKEMPAVTSVSSAHIYGTFITDHKIENPEVFFLDDHNIWSYREDVGVFVNDNTRLVVAPDIPSFLAQWDFENSIAYKLMFGHPLSATEDKYVTNLSCFHEPTLKEKLHNICDYLGKIISFFFHIFR